MITRSLRTAKELLGAVLPDDAKQAYRMARWRINARRPARGADRWVNLRYLALRQRAHGAKAYARFLRRADPGLNLPILSGARFVGTGWGDWNLNLYRAGNIGNTPVFEKIYLSGSDPLRKLDWLHDTVLPQLGAAIRTPPILSRVQGDCLTALYFPLLHLGDPVTDDTLLHTAEALDRAAANFHWAGTDPTIRDFRRDLFYCAHRSELLHILSRHGRDPRYVFSIEDWLQRPEMPHRFNHGDLSSGNVLACGTLLDFDHCGFYPAGYDCGAALRCSRTPVGVAELEILVDRHLARGCASTQLAILFFMAIFGSIGSAENADNCLDEAFLLSLWDPVVKRYGEQQPQVPSGFGA